MNKRLFKLLLALGTVLFLVLACCKESDDRMEKWADLLRGEDFGTGLLKADLEKPQQELFREWALSRGFQPDENGITATEDSWSWDYTREDDVHVSYDYIRGWPGPIHWIRIQRYSVPIAEPVQKIKGVPPELTLGTSVKNVIAKWGLSSEFNREEMSNRKLNEGHSMRLLYSAEFQDHITYLTVRFWEDTISCVSLRFDAMGATTPGSKPTLKLQDDADA